MLKLTMTFELDEEQLRDIFEANDLKFTKKKMKELQVEMEESVSEVQTDMEERFEEIVDEWIMNQFEE